jgi:hypothetical protein
LSKLKVISTDRQNPRLVCVSLQQFPAESEEGQIRHAIILQKNRALDLLKHPVNPAGHSLPATEILISRIRPHIASPVNRAQHGARRIAAGSLRLIARTICNYKQRRRLSQRDSLEDFGRLVRAIEDKKRDGCRKRGHVMSAILSQWGICICVAAKLLS